ncbi:MAG TPA: BAX inhibitor protein, partial [Methylophaga sp.]|nr:BAX inhibitor protein [Methylophaga sp.]
MNYDTQSTVVRSRESALQTNKLLRNTYVLLAMTLGFSALTAGVSMVF